MSWTYGTERYEYSVTEEEKIIADADADTFESLRAQVIEQQAVIEQMREALDEFLVANDPSEFGCACDLSVGYLCGPCFADKQQYPLRKAIALAPSSEALEARDRVRDAKLLKYTGKVIQLYDDATIGHDYMLDSDDAEQICNELAIARESGEWTPEI